MKIGEDSFLGKLSFKRIGERDLVVQIGIGGTMRSKDTGHEEGIERDGKEREERIEEVEGTESDTEVVTELRGRDGEIEITMESTKIGEGRVDEVAGSGEDVKGKEAGRIGEECGGGSTGSSAWPWFGSDNSTASSLTCGNTELLFNLISRLSLLRKQLSLRRSDRCCTRKA